MMVKAHPTQKTWGQNSIWRANGDALRLIRQYRPPSLNGCICTGLPVCSGPKKVAFWPIWRRPVLHAGGCFGGGVFADVLLFSSGFGSLRSCELYGTVFDRVTTVLLVTKYDPDSLSPEEVLPFSLFSSPPRRGLSNGALVASNGQVGYKENEPTQDR